MHTYSAFNMTITSELLLPELLPLSSAGIEPEIEIQYGKVPLALSAVAFKKRSWEAEPGKFLIRIHQVASYLVQAGKNIVIERCPGSSEKDVRTFLLGTPIAALLNQRKHFVLHASGIQTKSGAVLFAGESGSGKSTLMNAFMRHGYAMLSDDVTGILLNEGRPLALPALPRSRLWADSLAALDISTANLQKQRSGMDKFLLPVPNFCNESLPVFAIYFLTSHNRPELELHVLKEHEQLAALIRQTFRKQLVYRLGNQTNHFNIMTAISSTSRMFRVIRPATRFSFEEMVEQIESSWD